MPPTPIRYLSNTDIFRAAERQHSVQRGGCDGNLGLVGARPKCLADYPLVPVRPQPGPGPCDTVAIAGGLTAREVPAAEISLS